MRQTKPNLNVVLSTCVAGLGLPKSEKTMNSNKQGLLSVSSNDRLPYPELEVLLTAIHALRLM